MYINKAKKRLEINQEKYERNARKTITQTVNTNMMDYSHNAFTANVDENFNVNLTVTDTETIAAGVGPGTEMLSKLSFVTSLISQSKLRKNEINNNIEDVKNILPNAEIILPKHLEPMVFESK